MLEKLAVVFKTKVGLALVGALVLGGGGSAMAMANTNPQFFSHLVTAVTHSDETPNPTKAAKQGDQGDDNAACASRTPGAQASVTPDADEQGTPGTHTDAQGTPGTHADAEGTPGTRSDGEGTPSATHTAGADSHEGSETDCEGHEHSATGTHTPEPTEHPEGTRTPEPWGTHSPEPSPTGGHGGD